MAPDAFSQWAIKTPIEIYVCLEYDLHLDFLANGGPSNLEEARATITMEAIEAFEDEFRAGKIHSPKALGGVASSTPSYELPWTCKTKVSNDSSELDRNDVRHLSRDFDRVFRPEFITRTPANRDSSAPKRSTSKETGTPYKETGNANSKRKRLPSGFEEQGGEEDEDGDDDEMSRRPPALKRSKGPNFACPFYQRDKLEIWPRVCKTAFEDVARVKTHVVSHPIHNALELDHKALSQHDDTISRLPETDSLSCNTRSHLVIRVITDDQSYRQWYGIFRICFPGESPPSPFFGSLDKPLQENYAPPLETRVQFLRAVGNALMTKTGCRTSMPKSPDELLDVVQEVVENALDTLDLDLVKRYHPRVASITLGNASTNAPSTNSQFNDSVYILDDDHGSLADGSANLLDDASQGFFTDATHFSWTNSCPDFNSKISDGEKATDEKAGSAKVDGKKSFDTTLGGDTFADSILDGYIPSDDPLDGDMSTGDRLSGMFHSSSYDG